MLLLIAPPKRTDANDAFRFRPIVPLTGAKCVHPYSFYLSACIGLHVRPLVRLSLNAPEQRSRRFLKGGTSYL